MGLERWELLRALGAVTADPGAAGKLGLPPVGETGHNEVFTVNCPPFASLYLGGEKLGGYLGGEELGGYLGGEELGGYLGGEELGGHLGGEELDGPAEADHLAVLLDRYAGLGEAGEDGARRALFGEFLWPWLPAYLGAVLDLPPGPLTRWAELTLDALRHEREQDLDPAGPLPRALREAPPPVRLGYLGRPGEPDAGADGLVEGLVEGLLTPLRSGMILTRRAVTAGAEQVGAGQRIGNRRRALGAMLAAEPERAARWLADEAERWARRHRASQHGASRPGASRPGAEEPDTVQLWWAERAAGTARLLRGAYALGEGDPGRSSVANHAPPPGVVSGAPGVT